MPPVERALVFGRGPSAGVRPVSPERRKMSDVAAKTPPAAKKPIPMFP
jgi:hypothetical protein